MARERENWNTAFDQLRQAIAKSQSTADRRRFISTYTSWLLLRGETADAELWLDQLAEIDEGTGVHGRLRASWHARRGDHAQAIDELRALPELAKLTTDKTASHVEAAKYAMRLGSAADEDARRLYEGLEDEQLRLAVKQDRKRRFAYAQSLVRRNRPDDAVKLLQAVKTTAEELALAIRTVETLVASGELEREQSQWLATYLETLSKEFGSSLDLQKATALVKSSLGDVAAAEEIYRDILEAEPRDLAVLNNLAMLLANADKDLDEAATLSNRSLEIAGPIPELLDTRAVIALAQGDAQTALNLLEQATSSIESPLPVILFHRAVAYSRLGKNEEAMQDLAAVRESGFSAGMLGEREKQWFDVLSRSKPLAKPSL
jgi:tetratricopeptide (TPR) repeat protein